MITTTLSSQAQPNKPPSASHSSNPTQAKDISPSTATKATEIIFLHGKRAILSFPPSQEIVPIQLLSCIALDKLMLKHGWTILMSLPSSGLPSPVRKVEIHLWTSSTAMSIQVVDYPSPSRKKIAITLLMSFLRRMMDQLRHTMILKNVSWWIIEPLTPKISLRDMNSVSD